MKPPGFTRIAITSTIMKDVIKVVRRVANGVEFETEGIITVVVPPLPPSAVTRRTPLHELIRLLGTVRETPLPTSTFQSACMIEIQSLIYKGADVNAQDGELKNGVSQGTPLHFASNFHLADIVRLLHNSGAKRNVVDSVGCTPMHYAATFPHTTSQGTLTALLETGADPRTRCDKGLTPLDMMSSVARVNYVGGMA